MATHYTVAAACHRPLLSFHSSSSSRKPSSSKTKKNHSSFSSAILLAAGAAAGVAFAPAAALAALEEPANALSLPTWAIHVSSVVEWIAAMVLVWQYGDKSGLQTWKGLSWGMVLTVYRRLCLPGYNGNSPSVATLHTAGTGRSSVALQRTWPLTSRMEEEDSNNRCQKFGIKALLLLMFHFLAVHYVHAHGISFITQSLSTY
ncbi:uncharacterized protein M6B38_170730 [Iris pallida]|uniref:Uncharacterized protein n=1 Tax=Iris pallida TaxID=29817 RepID=A0AAX6EUW9_IRIPA|nr:uncharacterized protein M6B38_170730 [Iris pallida]